MIDLRVANIDDAAFLLDCRNDDTTRASSHNSENIDNKTHITWLKNTLNSENRVLYIAEIAGRPVATARIDFIVKDHVDIAELSWTV